MLDDKKWIEESNQDLSKKANELIHDVTDPKLAKTEVLDFFVL